MDYIEVFKNLRANNKYGRKSPHKAVLMLTIIEMYEDNILTDNEIYYDDKLKSIYLKVWNNVLPNNRLFHSEAYLPFWYMQNDSFWHIVPIRGKENILSLMLDTNVEPSEMKLNESVKYAELDDDLYFLMTIASGRSSLKRALLETYTQLSNRQIDSLSESIDNTIDHSTAAISEYESLLSGNEVEKHGDSKKTDDALVQQFQELSEDVQIVLNLEYYSFLKKQRNDREMMKEVCPTIYDLLDKIVNHPVKQWEIAPSFTFTYENFLADLKISLMSENDSMELINKIDIAIDILHGNTIEQDKAEIEESKQPTEEEQAKVPIEDKENNKNILEVEHVYLDSSGNIINILTTSSLYDTPAENRSGKAWTQEEEELITRYFQQGNDTATIARIIGRTEVAIKSRLAKLGLIDYTYGQEEVGVKPSDKGTSSFDDFKIENSFTRCSILNYSGEKVYATDGKMKFINGKLYRLNLKKECFTVKSMIYNGEVWMKGSKKIIAYPDTTLYKVIDTAVNYLDIVEDIADSPVFEECRLKVNGEWYNHKGELQHDIVMNDKYSNNEIQDSLNFNRKQAILRAMSYFRTPAKIRDLVRTISRTAWGAPIKEKDVERIINDITEIESIEGKYILRKKSTSK